MNSKPNVGLSLLWVGMFFGFLSLLFFINRPLLAISNVLLVLGFLFLMGAGKFFTFFGKKIKGTMLYWIGFVLLMIKLDSDSLMTQMSVQFVGLLVQMLGCYLLFEEFLPNLISYLQLTPFNKVLRAPVVKTCVNFLDKKTTHLPS
ncbi:conserved hypothetical protein [Theileria orientalis strain Shintoku]|uniref:Uncharacterized protein n=1 Tax=Theileria orientalis strain Shintoku TaxID=869250 RepID=J7M8K6_THEOR|nr:conserved hypothetical protein [Theileria orientalis strain Shintoku]PVC51757.1 hypothetical protein MACL_00001324 [Theileria orientalis]BAM42378.1 conserved hypothetical protein [Theileria orientalis strain Shintoku]|eukprot:XP_009692679.1 conserved hypothetical protein [Theileria orientalis strain Shintoku]